MHRLLNCIDLTDKNSNQGKAKNAWTVKCMNYHSSRDQ